MTNHPTHDPWDAVNDRMDEQRSMAELLAPRPITARKAANDNLAPPHSLVSLHSKGKLSDNTELNDALYAAGLRYRQDVVRKRSVMAQERAVGDRALGVLRAILLDGKTIIAAGSDVCDYGERAARGVAMERLLVGLTALARHYARTPDPPQVL